jgi:hypothetical protein
MLIQYHIVLVVYIVNQFKYIFQNSFAYNFQNGQFCVIMDPLGIMHLLQTFGNT